MIPRVEWLHRAGADGSLSPTPQPDEPCCGGSAALKGSGRRTTAQVSRYEPNGVAVPTRCRPESRFVGSDIYGAIECRLTWGRDFVEDPMPWSHAIDLVMLYSGRDYDAFACLFGVRNFAGFEPVAADRGIPADASKETRQAANVCEPFDPTWITWPEIEAIDWDQQATRPDARLHQYARGEDGEWREHGKSEPDREFAMHAGLSLAEVDARSRPAGTEWLIGDELYRSEVMLRRDAIPAGGEWEPVWQTMSTLAQIHGADNVRLIVWFDQ
jgi:hypothetical protein